jgi:hypothetical protein
MSCGSYRDRCHTYSITPMIHLTRYQIGETEVQLK